MVNAGRLIDVKLEQSKKELSSQVVTDVKSNVSSDLQYMKWRGF